LLLVAAAADAAAFNRTSPELAKVADTHGIMSFLHCRSQALGLVDQLTKNTFGTGMPLTTGDSAKLAGIAKEAAEIVDAKKLPQVANIDSLEQTFLELLPKVVTPAQVRRFRELHCQTAGVMALRHDTYARELGLSAEQQKAVGKLVDEAYDESLNLHRAIFVLRSEAEMPQFGRPPVALAWKLDSDILRLLTERQRRAWIDLLGKPIDAPELISSVSLSPDGSKIAFAGTRTGYEGYIGVVNCDGTNRRIVRDDGEFAIHPRFSPDGQRLLYSTSAGGRWGLCTVETDGKNLRQLEIGERQAIFGCFSLDSTRVVFGSHHDVTALLDLQSGQCRTLDKIWNRPVISPDGRMIVCQKERDMYETIVPGSMQLASADGAWANDLGVIGYNPEFSRDGRIVFLSGEDGRQDIWSMKPDRSDQRQLTKTGGTKRSLSAAAGADKIIFLHQAAKDEPLQLYEMSLDGTGLQKLVAFH
jgi:hypothetical protein